MKIQWVRSVKLKEPIQLKESVIEEIQFRKPKAKDVRHLKLGETPDMGQILDIAGSISDLPTAKLIDEIGMKDMEEVTEVVDHFLQGFQENGPQPSES